MDCDLLAAAGDVVSALLRLVIIVQLFGRFKEDPDGAISDAVFIDGADVHFILLRRFQVLQNVRHAVGVEQLVVLGFVDRCRAEADVVRDDRLAERLGHLPAQDGERRVDVGDAECGRRARKYSVTLEQAVAQVVHVLDAAELVEVDPADVARAELHARRRQAA